MDFHSLNRRQLQSLCKLNKIPANITNVAMADALKSLQTVEGIEEFLNPSLSETAGLSNESSEKIELMSPLTSCRTSTRRNVKKTYVDFMPATTSRGVRKQVAGEANDVLKTQSVASTRKKAPETSSRQNVACQDTVKKEETTVQRVYSTRRSTRLTEKKCAEAGVMDRERSQPVKIGSFLEEKESGNLVSEKSLGSETSHKSDISSENTKDSVAEGSVEICDVGFSKAKLEDMCNVFENVELEERQNVGEKVVLNGVDIPEEENAYVDPDKHSDSLFSDKASFVSEANAINADAVFVTTGNPSDAPSSELEDMSYVVSQTKIETLECNGSTNMARDFVHFNSENPSELSKLDNPDSHNVAKDATEEDIEENIFKFTADGAVVDYLNFDEQDVSMDFGPPAEEEHENISKSPVDTVLVDFVNPNVEEPSMSFEASAEEEQEVLTEDTAVDMDADKVTHESAADVSFIKENQFSTNANEAIDHPIHLSAMKQQIIRDGPTSLKGMTKARDNDENSGIELQGAIVDDDKSVNEKAEDEKPKSLNEISLRQLKKQLKALTIKSNINTNKDDMVAEARPALQAVCDNQLATGEDN